MSTFLRNSSSTVGWTETEIAKAIKRSESFFYFVISVRCFPYFYPFEAFCLMISCKCLFRCCEPEEEQQELDFWKKNQPKENGQGKPGLFPWRNRTPLHPHPWPVFVSREPAVSSWRRRLWLRRWRWWGRWRWRLPQERPSDRHLPGLPAQRGAVRGEQRDGERLLTLERLTFNLTAL